MRTHLKIVWLALTVIGLTLSGLESTQAAAKPASESSSAQKKASKNKAKNKAPANKTTASKSSKLNKTSSKKTSTKQTAALPKARQIVKARTAPVPNKSWQEARALAVSSNAALVVDQRDGQALYQKNANQIVPIASITKLMTAMVVLDASPDLAATITIADDDVDYLRGSRSRLAVGTQMTRETALLLALMSSENRAAHALSRHYPGGLNAFIAAMNAKTRALGMPNTRFEDPTGLTHSNVSTAQDLAKMVAAAYRYPLIRDFTTTSEATIDINGRELAYHNTNPLVKSSSWDVGLSKTGFIHEAGKCLVMQARVADRPVVIVLLDAAGKQTRQGDANRIKRWMENTFATQAPLSSRG